MEDLKQQLAAIEHERWADWQKWCHKIIRQTIASNGSIEEILSRWDKQINTPYAALSATEQASDMEQVDRYWPLIQLAIDKAVGEALNRVREALGPMAELHSDICADEDECTCGISRPDGVQALAQRAGVAG